MVLGRGMLVGVGTDGFVSIRRRVTETWPDNGENSGRIWCPQGPNPRLKRRELIKSSLNIEPVPEFSSLSGLVEVTLRSRSQNRQSQHPPAPRAPKPQPGSRPRRSPSASVNVRQRPPTFRQRTYFLTILTSRSLYFSTFSKTPRSSAFLICAFLSFM